MRRYIALLAIGAAGLMAQAPTTVRVQPDCLIPFNFIATGNTSQFDNRGSVCTVWVIDYSSHGFTGLSLLVQSAPDSSSGPGTWVSFAGTVTPGVNPNTATTQAETRMSGFYPWMRVQLTSVTGTGRIQGTLYGWKTVSAASGGGGGGGGGSCGSNNIPCDLVVSGGGGGNPDNYFFASVLPTSTTTGFANFSISGAADSLAAVTSGDSNTAVGSFVLPVLTSGHANVAVGNNVASRATTIQRNVFVGNDSGISLVGTSDDNVVIGDSALSGATNSSLNVVIGSSAGSSIHGNQNTIIGTYAGDLQATGSNNVYVGYTAGENLTGSNNLCIQVDSSVPCLVQGDFLNTTMLFHASTSTFTGLLITGSGTGVAGALSLVQGTAPASFPANSFSFFAPTAIATAYRLQVPAADAPGALFSDGGGTPGHLSFHAPTGTGTKVASATAAGVSGDCVKWDASGNVTDAGSPCGSGGGTGYATIEDEGSALPQQNTVNFIGAGVTCVDNAGLTRTDCTIPGGGGGGGSVTQGTFAAFPVGTCTTGDVYFFTDSVYQARCSGTNTWSYFMQPYGLVTPPPSTAWTWDNQGSSTVDATNGYLYLDMKTTGGATNARGYYRTAPATPYTVTFAFNYLGSVFSSNPGGSVFTAGVMFRDGTGKLMTYSVNNGFASTIFFMVTEKWTTSASYIGTLKSFSSSDSTQIVQGFERGVHWMQISDDGVNLIFRYSLDGQHFFQFDTQPRTAFFASGPTQYGIAMVPQDQEELYQLLSMTVQ